MAKKTKTVEIVATDAEIENLAVELEAPPAEIIIEMAGVVVPTNDATAYTAEVQNILKSRFDAAPNENFAKHMASELKAMTAPSVIAFMMEHKLPTEPLKTIAIYALQKVSRLIEFSIGAAKSVDPYSSTLIKNSLAMKEKGIAFNAELQMAGLSHHCEAERKLELPVRYRSAKSTASTQKSSSTAAFEYLGMIEVMGRGNTVMSVDAEHPVVKKLTA